MMPGYLAKIIHDNEQDQAECRQWMALASGEDILRVWMCCQQKFETPEMEIMSRFAQLKIAEMIEELETAVRNYSSDS